MAWHAQCVVSGRTGKTIKTALCAGHAKFVAPLQPPLASALQDQRRTWLRVNAMQVILEMESYAHVVLVLGERLMSATVSYLTASNCMVEIWIAVGS